MTNFLNYISTNSIMKKQENNYIFSLLGGLLINIMFYTIIYKYILDNDTNNCECSISKYHYYLKKYTPYLIALALLNILSLYLLRLITFNLKFYKINQACYLVWWFVVLFLYYFNIKKNCKCSYNWKRYLIPLPLYGLLLLPIIAVLIHFNTYNNI